MKKEKKDYVVISVSLSPKIIEKLNATSYNRSKLIDNLLDEYFDKEEKKKENKN